MRQPISVAKLWGIKQSEDNMIVTTRAQAPIHENTELSWPCSSGCKMLIKFEFVRLLALHNQPVNILQIYDMLRKLGARFCFIRYLQIRRKERLGQNLKNLESYMNLKKVSDQQGLEPCLKNINSICKIIVTYKPALSLTAMDTNIILQFTKSRNGRLWMLNVITKLKLDKEITMTV